MQKRPLLWKRSFQVIHNPGKVIPSGKRARSFPEFQIPEINELKTFGKPVAKQVYGKFCYVFFSARGFTRDAKVRWSALTKKWCWSCCDSWRKRHDAHTSVTGPGLHVSIIYHNLDHRLLYCLVSVRLLLRPSRSIHFGDVSEANGRETATLRPLDHVTRKALAAWQGALLDILSLGWRLGRCFVELHYGNVLETPSLLFLFLFFF